MDAMLSTLVTYIQRWFTLHNVIYSVFGRESYGMQESILNVNSFTKFPYYNRRSKKIVILVSDVDQVSLSVTMGEQTAGS